MRRWTATNGRVLVSPSREFRKWNEDQLWLLKAQNASLVEEVTSIEMIMYAPDNRKSDLSNKWESIGDLLVSAGVIKDDNWFIVPKLLLIFAGVDKNNPRVEVIIH